MFYGFFAEPVRWQMRTLPFVVKELHWAAVKAEELVATVSSFELSEPHAGTSNAAATSTKARCMGPSSVRGHRGRTSEGMNDRAREPYQSRNRVAQAFREAVLLSVALCFHTDG